MSYPQQSFTVRNRPVSVTIVRNKSTGERAAKIAQAGRTFYVPANLLPHCGRKDKWMRAILLACLDCRAKVRADTTECGLCPACYEKAGEENAQADGRKEG